MPLRAYARDPERERQRRRRQRERGDSGRVRVGRLDVAGNTYQSIEIFHNTFR